SPDDLLITFSRAPGPDSSSYSNPDGEVMVVRAEGSVPVRLKANDPPACTGRRSPGVTNSWPKWAPNATSFGDQTYYWLTFSSTRGDDSTVPQLYMTAISVDRRGPTPQIVSYGAIYLWNQPSNEHNHTPAWDVFELPIQ